MANDPAEHPASRTDLAEDRTILANERTFAGWLRTGLGAIGIGLAFNALFTRLEPAWVPRLIASVFLATAILIFVAAERRATVVLRRLQTHEVRSASVRTLRAIAGICAGATAALIVGLWLLPIAPR